MLGNREVIVFSLSLYPCRDLPIAVRINFPDGFPLYFLQFLAHMEILVSNSEGIKMTSIIWSDSS